MTARKATTKAQLGKWQKATRAEKSVILDAVCEVTGWHRDHARKATDNRQRLQAIIAQMETISADAGELLLRQAAAHHPPRRPPPEVGGQNGIERSAERQPC